MSNYFQKALKINKYVWNKLVWLSSTLWRDTKDFFFCSQFSCHLKSNKIHRFDHGSAAQTPRKGHIPQKDIGMSQNWMSPIPTLAGLVLAHLATTGAPSGNCLCRVFSSRNLSRLQSFSIQTSGKMGIMVFKNSCL